MLLNQMNTTTVGGCSDYPLTEEQEMLQDINIIEYELACLSGFKQFNEYSRNLFSEYLIWAKSEERATDVKNGISDILSLKKFWTERGYFDKENQPVWEDSGWRDAGYVKSKIWKLPDKLFKMRDVYVSMYGEGEEQKKAEERIQKACEVDNSCHLNWYG